MQFGPAAGGGGGPDAEGVAVCICVGTCAGACVVLGLDLFGLAHSHFLGRFTQDQYARRKADVSGREAANRPCRAHATLGLSHLLASEACTASQANFMIIRPELDGIKGVFIYCPITERLGREALVVQRRPVTFWLVQDIVTHDSVAVKCVR